MSGNHGCRLVAKFLLELSVAALDIPFRLLTRGQRGSDYSAEVVFSASLSTVGLTSNGKWFTDLRLYEMSSTSP